MPKFLAHNILTNFLYLKCANYPTFEKTKKYFHAKDDTPEVREKVFKMIANFDLKAEFIVARKKEKIFKNLSIFTSKWVVKCLIMTFIINGMFIKF